MESKDDPVGSVAPDDPVDPDDLGDPGDLGDLGDPVVPVDPVDQAFKISQQHSMLEEMTEQFMNSLKEKYEIKKELRRLKNYISKSESCVVSGGRRKTKRRKRRKTKRR